MSDGHRSRNSSSEWTRKASKARSLFGNMMGGLRGGTNIASWAVAFSLAYYLWVRPSQELKRQQQERIAAAQSASSVDSKTQIQETESVHRDSDTKPTNSKTQIQETESVHEDSDTKPTNSSDIFKSSYSRYKRDNK